MICPLTVICSCGQKIKKITKINVRNINVGAEIMTQWLKLVARIFLCLCNFHNLSADHFWDTAVLLQTENSKFQVWPLWGTCY